MPLEDEGKSLAAPPPSEDELAFSVLFEAKRKKLQFGHVFKFNK